MMCAVCKRRQAKLPLRILAMLRDKRGPGSKRRMVYHRVHSKSLCDECRENLLHYLAKNLRAVNLLAESNEGGPE